MNYQQGGGGQYPQQGPRKLLKQRMFPKDGPAMTSTPYQGYNPPGPGFNVTPQMNDDWARDTTPQLPNPNTYNAYSTNHFQPQQPYAQPYMMPQQPPGFNVPPGYSDLMTNQLVTNMAKEYGMNYLGSTVQSAGGQVLSKVEGLKKYFAVDTRYVMRKLKLILFPFLHKEWGVHYEENRPVQPRYEINAPDLYIPVMAYVTYILLAGLVLGIQNRFSPEKLGVHASTATGCALVELLLQSVFLYVTNIQSDLKYWDLLAYSGYKYVGIVLAILIGQVFQWTGYLVCISYCGIALAFFMMRSLKSRVLESPPVQQDAYGQSVPPPMQHIQGTKRRMYFLVFVALSQPVLMLWVSYHLISSNPSVISTLDPSAQATPL